METGSSPGARRSQRIVATIPISLFPHKHDRKEAYDAYTMDLSRFGARIRSNFELSVGDEVGVLPSGDPGQAIRSRVVWVQRTSTSESYAGLEFLSPLQPPSAAPH